MRLLLVLASLALALGTAQAATPLRVVPGSSVAYMYFPGKPVNNKVMLKVEKKSGFTHFEVLYQLDDHVPRVVCAADETVCEFAIGVGKVKLAVQGEFAAGVSIGAANWAGDCSAQGTKACEFTSVGGTTPYVGVSAGCDGSDASIAQLNGSDVLCVGWASNNELMLAAHKQVTEDKMLNAAEKRTCGNTDLNDGRVNAGKLLSPGIHSNCKSPAVGQCAALVHAGLGAGAWYLPAREELSALRPTSPAELKDRTLWSSTERNDEKSYALPIRANGMPEAVTSLKKHKSKGASNVLCYTRR